MANLSNINNKFLVTTTGEVLIGQTSNNGNRLQITGADGASYIYLKTDVATTGGRIGFNGDALRVFNQQASGELQLGTAGTSRVRISNSLVVFPTITELRGDVAAKFAIGNMGGASSQMMVSSRGFLTLNVSNTGSALDATERMRIDSSGNVGINDTNPNTANLSIKGQSTGVSANYPMLKLLGQNTSSDGLHITTTGTGNNYYAIKVATGADSSAFNVTNAGNVGIGTTTPEQDLHIKRDGEAAVISLERINSNAGYLLLNGSINPNIAYPNNQDLRFATVSNIAFNDFSERMRIDSSGNIRFTGTAPSSGDEITQLNFYNTSSSLNLARITGIRQAGGTNYGALTFSTTNSGTLAERMRITSGGMVGIGMTPSTVGSSTYVLQMYNPGSQCFLSLGNSTSGNGPLNGLVIGNDASNAYIVNREATSLIFATSDANRMTILAGGNVGIGTTNPTQKLHLDGNNYNTATRTTFLIRDVGNNYDQGDNAIDIVMRSRYWSGDQNTSQNSKIRHLKDNSNGSTGTQLRFSTTTRGAGDSSDKMTILAGGNVGIGTTSPQGKLDSVAPVADLTDFGRATGSALNIRIANVIGYLGQINFCNDAAPEFGYGSIGMVMTSGSGVGLGDMVFGTKSSGSAAVSTERMRITSAGRVTINNKPNSGLPYNVLIDIGTGATGDVGYQTLSQLNTNLAGASDIRFKKNIEIIPNAIEKIKTINGYTFDWDSENEDYNYSEKEGRDAGVIAQEIQKVLPEVVQIAPVDRNEEGKSTSGKNYLSVDYKKIIPLLIQGIKEQETSIQELKAEIELLKSK